jgi:thymidine kinase
MPSLDSQMPLVFRSGEEVREIGAHCGVCGQKVPGENIRGRVFWPLKTVVVIEAAAYCRDCMVATPLDYRLYEDGRIIEPVNGAQDVGSWDARTGLFDRIKSFLFGACA